MYKAPLVYELLPCNEAVSGTNKLLTAIALVYQWPKADTEGEPESLGQPEPEDSQ